MLAILSPAKTLDFESPVPDAVALETPRLVADAERLVKVLRTYGEDDLRELMSISAELAAVNHERFATWRRRPRPAAVRPALLAFRGDVYRGLDADRLDADGLRGAQARIRILSGLYGVLRPFDAMQPYRLEMGTPLPTDRGANLYEFWGDRVAKLIRKDLDESPGERALVNLASNEYARVLPKGSIDAPIVDVAFREEKDGKVRSITLFAKEARGAMAGWMAETGVDDVAGLRRFRRRGYRLSKADSTDTSLVFVRPQPAPVAEQRRTARAGR